jgi:site-specific DNA recombinase
MKLLIERNTPETPVASSYSRKSTEQERVKGGSTESIVRQNTFNQEFIASKQWVLGECYSDDAVSGLEYANLNGRKRMVADAEAGKFQVLVVTAQDRLGRDKVDQLVVLRDLTELGVTVISRTEGKLDVDEGFLHAAIRSEQNRQEALKAGLRVYEAQVQRARDGFITGQASYGYRSIATKNNNTWKRLQIEPTEAAIMVRIFTMYADGLGTKNIARKLNDDEHVPGPGGRLWGQGGIREMLKNPVYRGELVWNKRRSFRRKGSKRRFAVRPQSEWITAQLPELRIIDDILWAKVKQRREHRRRSYPRSPSTGKLMGRASWQDGQSEYLFSGFGLCAVCGGRVRIEHRKNGPNHSVRRLYLCNRFDESGLSACSNGVRVLDTKLDAALVQALVNVLDPALLGEAVDLAVEHLRQHHASSLDRRAGIDKELETVQTKVSRLTEALADDSLPVADIKAALQPLTARRQVLADERASLKDAETLASLDSVKLKKDLLGKVQDVRTLFGTETQQSRALLRRLLAEPIKVTPYVNGTKKGWKFSGTLVVSRLATGEAVELLGSAAASAAGREFATFTSSRALTSTRRVTARGSPGDGSPR